MMEWDARTIFELIQRLLAVAVVIGVVYELVTGTIRYWDFGPYRVISRREDPPRYWRLMALHIVLAAMIIYFILD
jgi:hypothetical protein